jgi:hypothetical protein
VRLRLFFDPPPSWIDSMTSLAVVFDRIFPLRDIDDGPPCEAALAAAAGHPTFLA